MCLVMGVVRQKRGHLNSHSQEHKSHSLSQGQPRGKQRKKLTALYAPRKERGTLPRKGSVGDGVMKPTGLEDVEVCGCECDGGSTGLCVDVGAGKGGDGEAWFWACSIACCEAEALACVCGGVEQGVLVLSACTRAHVCMSMAELHAVNRCVCA